MMAWMRLASALAAIGAMAESPADANMCLPCNPKDVPLPKPHFDNVTANNGVRWPTLCLQDTPEGEEEHVFTIGDWGAMANGKTMDNSKKRRKYVKGMDLYAQLHVAKIMKKTAKSVKPKYILNVGDNFYPGGIDAWCSHGGMDACSYVNTGQWDNIWEAVYSGPELGHLEWWSVMGNHDWGGADTYSRAWDQQIAFTWHNNKWLMPGLYWERKVVYCNFSIDYYFLDTNIYDVADVWDDPGHNFCNRPNWGGRSCKSIGGPTSPENCVSWFQNMFKNQIAWLEDGLARSTADWQIIITHFPPQFGFDVWKPLCKKYGVDIFVAGHRHQQEVHYKESWSKFDMGGTAWTVTGGGGGVTSEGDPRSEKETALKQQYGFMDFVVSKETIHIDMYSAASQKKMSRTTVTPIPKMEGVGPLAADGPMQETSTDGRSGDTHVAEDAAQEDHIMPFEPNMRMDHFRSSKLFLFDEGNVSKKQRCSATRRRLSYMKSAALFQISGAQQNADDDPADSEVGFEEQEWNQDPSDPNLLYSEHTGDLADCFERCGNKSGRCDDFCGVRIACCAKGVTTDAPECASAEGFTQSGVHECVGLKLGTGSLRKPDDVWLDNGGTETPTHGLANFSKAIIALGAAMVCGGLVLMTLSKSRRPKRSMRLKAAEATSESEEDPAE